MKRSTKLLTTGLLSTALVAPTMTYANNIDSNNAKINIDLEKRSILLGDTSKISISFDQKLQADSITINFLCYDMPLSATLNYNSQNNSYEGTINFNKDPEYLNVWQIENITINSETPEVLDRQKLEELGLNLPEYNITQEYIIDNTRSISTYMQKASAPVKELVGQKRFDTAAKISEEGWKTGADKVILVNGDAIADGITATPLASAMDAPILLVNKDNIPEATKNEISRLNPSDIIIIGQEGVISNKVEKELKSLSNVMRIGGINRYETSLKIAKELDDYNDVHTIFIANGYDGEADALTIAAKAGQDKQPIILSKKEEIPADTYKWLKTENLTNAYFIGGENNIATSVIHQVADITKVTSGSVYNNRVYGKNRYETNAKVMEKFYTESELNSVLVTKGEILVDALTAGPLAAKLNSPILLTTQNTLSSAHSNNLKNKTADLVYKVGGGVSDSVINDIAYKLSLQTAGGNTVVIDAGHGGTDPGKVYGNTQEKVYTLDVAMSTASYLRANNINVVLTRDTDKTLALGTRTDISNKLNPDLLASIHFNASNGVGYGIEIFHKVADKNGGPTKTAATNVLNSVLEKFGLRNRGLKTRTLDDGRDYLAILRNSTAPSILIECAFMDNATDIAMIDELHERQLMGTQIGKGIVKTVKN